MVFIYHKTKLYLNAIGYLVTVSRCTLLDEVLLKAEFVDEFLRVKGKGVAGDSDEHETGRRKRWLTVRVARGPASGAAAQLSRPSCAANPTSCPGPKGATSCLSRAWLSRAVSVGVRCECDVQAKRTPWCCGLRIVSRPWV